MCGASQFADHQVQIVPQWSAVMDGFNIQAGSIHANHMDMTKFRTRNDSGYKRVLYHIRRQIKESGGATEAGALPAGNDDRRETGALTELA